MNSEKFINPVNHDYARKYAVSIANEKRDLSFPENERNSESANDFWLSIFWKEFHSMVNKSQ